VYSLTWTASAHPGLLPSACRRPGQAVSPDANRTLRPTIALVSNSAHGSRVDGHRETRRAVRTPCVLPSDQLIERTSPHEEETWRLRLDADPLPPPTTTMSTKVGRIPSCQQAVRCSRSSWFRRSTGVMRSAARGGRADGRASQSAGSWECGGMPGVEARPDIDSGADERDREVIGSWRRSKGGW